MLPSIYSGVSGFPDTRKLRSVPVAATEWLFLDTGMSAAAITQSVSRQRCHIVNNARLLSLALVGRASGLNTPHATQDQCISHTTTRVGETIRRGLGMNCVYLALGMYFIHSSVALRHTAPLDY